MGSCMWLATYPKSGTTWVRFLIHELLVGQVRSSKDLDAFIPSIHDGHTLRMDELAWACTHKEYSQHAERYGPPGSGFVHVVRHPLDAMLSQARFFCLMQAGDVERREGSVGMERLQELMTDYLRVLFHSGTTPLQRRLGIESWARHTASWMSARDRRPHLLLRYEDLLVRPEEEVRRLAHFLGRTVSDPQLRDIVRRCSTESLRQMQEREITARSPGRFFEGDKFETAYRLGLRFVGTARLGEGWSLGPGAINRVQELFGREMENVGYTMDPDNPVVERAALRSHVSAIAAEA